MDVEVMPNSVSCTMSDRTVQLWFGRLLTIDYLKSLIKTLHQRHPRSQKCAAIPNPSCQRALRANESLKDMPINIGSG